MEKQLKEIIRSVVRKDFISELSKNDIHVKEIMKFYDKGTYSTKKAVSIFVSGKTNATRNRILDDLGDLGYDEIWDVMDHFKLKIESINESELKGYLVADVVDDIVKSIGSKFVSGQIKNAPNRNYIYLKLTDIKFGSGVVKMLKSQFGIDAKIDKTFGNIPSVSFASKKVVSESVNETTLNEGLGDSIKKIKNLAIKMATTKYDRAKSHLNIDKIASADEFDGTDAMNKATSALLQQTDLDEDLKSAINKIAVKLGTGATMMGIITALVSMSGWIQYLDSSFTKWYYTEIQKLAEPEVMKVMQDLGRAGQAEGSIYGKLGMYAFFIFFTIAVISLVAARMTKGTKKEYVDKKGVERVAAALPQTEEEPIKECKTCNSK